MKPGALILIILVSALVILGLRGQTLFAQETASDDAGVEAQTPDEPSGNGGAEGNGAKPREKRREAQRTRGRSTST